MVAMATDKPNGALRRLEARLAKISDVSAARSALHWDRQTYMPEGGVSGRDGQLATLSRLAHEMLVSGETAELQPRWRNKSQVPETSPSSGSLDASTNEPRSYPTAWSKSSRTRLLSPSPPGNRRGQPPTGPLSSPTWKG
jgi:Carboxypeptidase Taq (M32) metallopeptidase